MKFPDDAPRPITGVGNAPEIPQPGAVNAVRPVVDSLSAARQRYRQLAPATSGAAPTAPPRVDRRGQPRRAEDRRKAQENVLLDTRSGQDRRQQRRREEDDPPSGISIKV